MTKIIFLDIDGPMIPGRLFLAEGKDEVIPFTVSKFDHIAVDLINRLCEDHGWQLVLHTSWIKLVGGVKTYEHCINQGIRPEHFHKDAWCDEQEAWRYTRIQKWLETHPETTQYVIVDDTKYEKDNTGYVHSKYIAHHLLLIDFDNGILSQDYYDIIEGHWDV